jgi:hypothetical protein
VGQDAQQDFADGERSESDRGRWKNALGKLNRASLSTVTFPQWVGRRKMNVQSIYSGPLFEMTRRQFHLIADHLEIPEDERDRLLLPKRAITVACPIHMDTGRSAVFTGYRVQHHLALGAAKGGTRFAPSVDIGEVAALAIWMSWKWALADLRYGGGKGGTVDPAALSTMEIENLSRRYMQEMIPFVGPRVDVMAPDIRTNEQVMAWFMDTYSNSMYQEIAVPEIVTGKPVGLGGTLGRREATGHGVAFLAFRALDRLGIALADEAAVDPIEFLTLPCGILSRFRLANQRIGFLRFAGSADSQGVWHGGRVSGYGER